MSAAQSLIVACLVLAATGLSASADDDPLPTQPARQILDETIARLPRTQLGITGRLTIRRHRGVEMASWGFNMRMAWTDDGPRAQIETRDRFGQPIERMTIERTDKLKLTYAVSPSFTATNAPPLTTGIRGTDLTWLDLTLDYLWWPSAHLDGEGRTKGRRCDIIRVSPPYDLPGCHAARLWIDRKARLIIKAEQLDEKDRVVRRMWVESIKTWKEGGGMIKDLAVARPGAPTQTRLLIDDVDTQPPPAAP